MKSSALRFVFYVPRFGGGNSLEGRCHRLPSCRTCANSASARNGLAALNTLDAYRRGYAGESAPPITPVRLRDSVRAARLGLGEAHASSTPFHVHLVHLASPRHPAVARADPARGCPQSGRRLKSSCKHAVVRAGRLRVRQTDQTARRTQQSAQHGVSTKGGAGLVRPDPSELQRL